MVFVEQPLALPGSANYMFQSIVSFEILYIPDNDMPLNMLIQEEEKIFRKIVIFEITFM